MKLTRGKLTFFAIVLAGVALLSVSIVDLCEEEPSPSKFRPTVSDISNVTVRIDTVSSNASARVCVTNDAVRTATHVPVASVQKPLPAATNAVAVRGAAVRKVTEDPSIPRHRQVLLANRRIAVAEGRKFPKLFCTSQTPTARKTAPYVLIGDQPVNRDLHSQAMSDGAWVAGYLPPGALLVEADKEALKNLSEDPAFVAAIELEPMDKVQQQLLDAPGESVEATVILMNQRYFESIRGHIVTNGGSVEGVPSSKGKSFPAVLTRKLVTELAGKGEVRWIERRTP